MPPTEQRYRIRGPWPNCPTPVFYVDLEADGALRVATDDSIRLAKWFTKTEVLNRVKYLRENKLWNCRAVSGDGTVVFEDESRPALPPDDGVDRRDFLFYEPDGYEGTGLGYVIAPSVHPEFGKCWSVRCQDIPCLNGRLIESTYDKSPEQAILKFILICNQGGVVLTPSPRPDQDRRDHEELLGVIRDIKKSQQAPGQRRPGDL
jgi:hypothetical protein